MIIHLIGTSIQTFSCKDTPKNNLDIEDIKNFKIVSGVTFALFCIVILLRILLC